MEKSLEYRLDRPAQTAARALAELMARLEREHREAQEALADLAQRYAADHGLAPEGGRVRFDQRGDQIMLVVTPALEETDEQTDAPLPERT